MTNELKPCPFCGGGAQHCKDYYYSWDCGETAIHKIICFGCGAKIESFSEEKVFELWNRRVEDER